MPDTVGENVLIASTVDCGGICMPWAPGTSMHGSSGSGRFLMSIQGCGVGGYAGIVSPVGKVIHDAVVGKIAFDVLISSGEGVELKPFGGSDGGVANGTGRT